MLSEISQHIGPNIVQFYLYNVPRTHKFIESTVEVAREGLEVGQEWGVTV